MKKSNQFGFEPVIIVVAIVAVLVAGVIAWRLWDTSQQAKQDGNTQQQTNNKELNTKDDQQPSTDPNEGFVVIKEWGVRFKAVEGLNVEHFRAADRQSQYERFDLSTEALIAREPNCQKQGFSSITRTAEPQTTYEIQLAKIGSYYYRGSDAACSESSSNFAFEAEQRNATKQSLLSLEATKGN